MQLSSMQVFGSGYMYSVGECGRVDRVLDPRTKGLGSCVEMSGNSSKLTSVIFVLNNITYVYTKSAVK